jgi:hypothetical protein
MLIRKLTLAAFASLVTMAGSLALLADAAHHATPALADDHGSYQSRRDGDDRRHDDRRDRRRNDDRHRDDRRHGDDPRG